MILNNGKLLLLVCFVLAFLFVGWFLKRKNKLNISWEAFSNIGYVFFLGIAFYFSIILCDYFIKYNYHDRIFTKKEWINNEEKRYEICLDLINNNKEILLGHNKDDIINELGYPHISNDSLYYYYLGITPSLFAVDPEFLVIKFNDKNISCTIFRERKG